MMDVLTRIFANRSALDLFRSALDILVVAYVIYRSLLVVRGTRAMQMGVGLGVIFLIYLAAKVLKLVTLLNLLSYLLSSIILVVVVVFQNDIRRALIRVGGQAWFGRGRKQEQSRVIDEVVAAVTELARHRIGAMIAFEQDANLQEFVTREGTIIGAAVTRELLVALFYPESVNKLHDGAVIIRDFKIDRAGAFFPTQETKIHDKSLGTRHVAALAITEETDAVLVVVSEERGTISFCFNGNIVPNLDASGLREALVSMLEQKPKRAARARAVVEPTRTTSPVATPLPASRVSTPPPRPVRDGDRAEESTRAPRSVPPARVHREDREAIEITRAPRSVPPPNVTPVNVSPIAPPVDVGAPLPLPPRVMRRDDDDDDDIDGERTSRSLSRPMPRASALPVNEDDLLASEKPPPGGEK